MHAKIIQHVYRSPNKDLSRNAPIYNPLGRNVLQLVGI